MRINANLLREQAGVFLSGPGLRHAVTSAEEALRVVSTGDLARATAATDCNEHSSRSHAILSFHVESQRVSVSGSVGGVNIGGTARGSFPGKTGGVRLGKLHLVDLAGRLVPPMYIYYIWGFPTDTRGFICRGCKHVREAGLGSKPSRAFNPR